MLKKSITSGPISFDDKFTLTIVSFYLKASAIIIDPIFESKFFSKIFLKFKDQLILITIF
jgi:hypothetical protein